MGGLIRRGGKGRGGEEEVVRRKGKGGGKGKMEGKGKGRRSVPNK